MAKTTLVKPGHKVLDSGIYKVAGKAATLVKGKPAPPTPKPGQTWVQVVDTNPNNNKREHSSQTFECK